MRRLSVLIAWHDRLMVGSLLAHAATTLARRLRPENRAAATPAPVLPSGRT
jgi:hypothetical protein